jgi:pimeloyl-ACP methyl ester carboxylesterase
MTYPIESAAEDVDGLRVHYLKAGSGPLVVLLHGFPMHSYCWRRLMPLLAPYCTVVAIDQRGMGLTDRPKTGYDKRNLALDVRKFVQKIGFSKIAMLVGHDRGARIGHRFALDHSDVLERFVVLDVVPTREVFRSGDVMRLWHWTFHLQSDLAPILLKGNLEAYLRYFFRYAFNRGAMEEGVPEYVKAMERPGTLRAISEDYRASFEEDLKLDNADYDAGRRMTTPTLILYGENGPNVQFDMNEIWPRYATNVRVDSVPRCGYYMPEEAPQALAGRLLRFLNEQPAGTTSKGVGGGDRMNQVDAHVKLNELACEFIVSAALRVACQVGVADKIGDGAKTAEQLATELNVDGPTLYRVLRLLASKGLFVEGTDRTFRLTELGQPLRRNVKGSLTDGVLLLTHALSWQCSEHLEKGLKSGQPTFNEIFHMPFYEYVMKNPDTTFHAGMAGLSSMEDVPVAEAYDFSGFEKVIDVGGGSGGLVAEILRRNPKASGAVYDKPHVLAGAKLPEAAGVGNRCALVPGNFMESVPEGDCFLIKRILHNWSDEQCVTILKNCVKSMKKGGKVLVIEGLMKGPNEPDFMKTFDVYMMYFFASRERSESEFRALYAQAGLRLSRVVHTPTIVSIVEGTVV